MKHSVKKFSVVLAVVFCISMIFSFTASAASSNAVCMIQSITSLSNLNDGDTISFKNLHWQGASYLTWQMEGYFPKLKNSVTKPAVGDFSDRFTVKKFDDGSYGFYIISPFVAMKYFIAIADGTSTVDLYQENSIDINKAKWKVSVSSGKCYIKPVLKPTLYLYADKGQVKPFITFGAEGTNGGLDWALTKGVPCTVTFTKVADWGTGYEARITITNNGTKTISNWSLFMRFNAEISSIYDANIKSHTDNTYVIKNNNWNASIAPGATVSFGFSGTPGNISEAWAFDVLNN